MTFHDELEASASYQDETPRVWRRHQRRCTSAYRGSAAGMGVGVRRRGGGRGPYALFRDVMSNRCIAARLVLGDWPLRTLMGARPQHSVLSRAPIQGGIGNIFASEEAGKQNKNADLLMLAVTEKLLVALGNYVCICFSYPETPVTIPESFCSKGFSRQITLGQVTPKSSFGTLKLLDSIDICIPAVIN